MTKKSELEGAEILARFEGRIPTLTDPTLQRVALNFWMKQHELGKCRAPFAVTGAENVPIVVPCGKCLPCRRRYRDQVTGTAVAEATWQILLGNPPGQRWDITFDDENLVFPDDKDDVDAIKKRLIDRLTYHLGGVKYLLVWQVGPETGRLHGHAIIIPTKGVSLPEPTGMYGNFIDPDKLWPYGHRVVQEITPTTVGYLTNYLSKPDSSKGTFATYKSQLLGEAYFTDWCIANRKLPLTIPGAYYVDCGGLPRWFPMSRKYRELATLYGYEWQTPEEKLSHRKWLEEGGPILAKIGHDKDAAKQRELARQVFEKQNEHPDTAKYREALKARRNVHTMYR